MSRPPALERILLYVRDVERSAAFYEVHFGYATHREAEVRIVELHGPASAVSIMLHPAAKSQKTGQVTVKLVFGVEDVTAFAAEAKQKGLEFGPLLQGDGSRPPGRPDSRSAAARPRPLSAQTPQ